MAQNIGQSSIHIDDQQAQSTLKGLTAQVDNYTQKMNQARKANDKAGFDKAKKEYQAAGRELRAHKRTVTDFTAVLNNLNGSSLKELSALQRKLSKEVNELNRNTKEEIALYKEKTAQLKAVKTQMSSVRSEMNTTGASSKSFFSKLTDGFNKYSMVAMSAIAALTGIILAFRKAVDASNEYASSVANLSALTGLSGKELEWLSKRALDFSGSTTEAGVNIGIAAQDIVDAYTQMGSKRPELLKDKEALASVTEQAIILAAAAKMELVPATNSLATVMNMFNASATQAPRYINAIAAGSKAGAGNVEYIADALENAGTSANMAGLSMEETIAVVETIAPKFSRASRAGNQLKNIFLRLQSSSDDFNPKIVGMEQALNNLGDAQLSVAAKEKLFGRENINAAETLIAGRKEYIAYLAAVTDTNTAFEQANINTQTNAGRLEMVRQNVAKLTIELGEKLAPALTFSMSSFGKIIKGSLALIKFYQEYRNEIITTVAALASYYLTVQITSKWDKIHSAYLVAKSAITRAYALTVDMVTGKVRVATVAQRIWNAVQAANPIAIVIAALAAAATALFLYTKNLSTAEKAQNNLNDVMVEANKSIAEEKVKLDLLLKTARNEKLSKAERLAAIQKINQLSPKYLSNISLETINTDSATEALKKYNKELENKAMITAAQEKLVQIEKDLMDLRLKGEGAEVSNWQLAGIAIKNFGNAAGSALDASAAAAQNMNDKEQELIETKNKLLNLIGKTNETMDESNTADTSGDNGTEKELVNLRKLQEELTKLKADRLELSISDTEGLKLNAKQIEDLEKKIKLFTELGMAEKASKSKKNKEIDPLKEQAFFIKEEAKLRKEQAAELKEEREANIEDIETTHKKELLLIDTKYNEELLALGDNENAKDELTKQHNAERLQIQLDHLNELKSMIESQVDSSINIEDSMLSDEEKESLLLKIEELKFAISEIQLLADNPDGETEGTSFLSKMLFGEDADEATLAEKIKALGSMAMDAVNSINQIITNSENRQLQEFTNANNKKKQILEQRLNSGRISQEAYAAQVAKLDEDLEKQKAKLATEQAKRAKKVAIMSAIINTAVAVTGALGNPPGPAGVAMAVIVGLLGALQIAAIASEPVPTYAMGNYRQVTGAEDGKSYKAKLVAKNHKSGLYSEPTYRPGFGLFGETKDPELVFNPSDTSTIINSPELIDAINMTLGNAPQYASGNSREIIRENNTNTITSTDPALIALLERLDTKLDQPSKSYLVADEDYIRTHKKKVGEYDTFKSKVSG